jgi:prophage DNA circulation protein
MTINIIEIERSLPDGIVTTVHWVALKTVDENSVSGNGKTILDTPEGDIIPFEELTKEQVTAWVESKIDLVATEAELDAHLESIIAPKVATGLPWTSQS